VKEIETRDIKGTPPPTCEAQKQAIMEYIKNNETDAEVFSRIYRALHARTYECKDKRHVSIRGILCYRLRIESTHRLEATLATMVSGRLASISGTPWMHVLSILSEATTTGSLKTTYFVCYVVLKFSTQIISNIKRRQYQLWDPHFRPYYEASIFPKSTQELVLGHWNRRIWCELQAIAVIELSF